MLQKIKLSILTVLAALLLGFGPAQAIIEPIEPEGIKLEGYGFEIDGAIGGLDAVFFNAGSLGGLGSAIFGVDFSAFDPGIGTTRGSGLGTVTVAISGVGAHHVGFFVDHEIDEKTNTIFNEFGADLGALGAGQKWELDDPFWGLIQGDLDFQDLFNTNFLLGDGFDGGDDVSMALSHDFILGIDELALVTFVLGNTDPGGFRLKQTDSVSPDTIYFSSFVEIRGTTDLPEPGALAIFALGLFSIGLMTRRRRVPIRR